MIRPLRDWLVVEPLEDMQRGVIEIVRLDNKVRRGKIIAKGRKAESCNVGDVFQFTDVCKYPVLYDHGKKVLMMQEADICGIEVEEELAA